MMGRLVDQGALFYEVRREDLPLIFLIASWSVSGPCKRLPGILPITLLR